MEKSTVGVGVYGGDPGPVAAIGADVFFVHLPKDGDNHNAEAIRAANPNADIWGRFDDGRDNDQVDTSKTARDEAYRWYLKIKARVERSPLGTFTGVVGICEAWGTNLQWRADFEYYLTILVQDDHAFCVNGVWFGLHYAWGSIPVGNLEPEHIALFAPVIREAWAVNYHGYLQEGHRALWEETEPWHLWRPLDLWLPECKRLGLPFKRILLGEVGTYYCWQGQITREQYASLCIDVAREFGRRCAAVGVECIGGAGFGFGTAGTMAQWDMRGTESILAAAITDDHEEEPVARTLAQQFPAVYTAWVAAGGKPEAAFEAHLMGIGQLPAGKAEAIALVESLKGTAEQIAQIIGKLPLP